MLFFHWFDCLYSMFQIQVGRLFYAPMYRLRGVQLGKKCRYRGKMHVRLSPKSSICVGNRCTFNSSPCSNLLGVHSPCILATVKENAHISIGNDCGFSGTAIGCAQEIIIGDRVKCGANTVITDSDWHPDDWRSGPNRPVRIGNDVWLGLRVTVLKGVQIGDRALIGAGSVVTRDIPADTVAAGNPCRVIRPLPPRSASFPVLDSGSEIG